MDLSHELKLLHRASFGWALSCCRNQRQEAEDLLHNVYIKVLEGRARFDAQSSFKTWLFGVIRRTARENWRSRWLHHRLLQRWYSADFPRLEAKTGEEAVEVEERCNRLASLLASLSTRQRDILHLVFYQDLSVEESAQTLGITVGSARQHFDRGKRRLRSLLNGEFTP